ncbi:MAG: type II toxin-antitoxin system VapC family toxin [Solirubrobacterales bacterium]|nr:type II toxin-antitoxin system VapC family toxin [Solirubrobacterales bacterium]
MSATDVVSDANVVLKWFHTKGEEGVETAHSLLAAHRARTVAVYILDLTPYEVANALLRGRAQVNAKQASVVLKALREICPLIAPDDADLSLAAELAVEHSLTFYDAAYAAVARQRGIPLASFDGELVDAGLAAQPDELIARLDLGGS